VARLAGADIAPCDRELPYIFVSVEQLMADFLADVRRMRGTI
jgi:hypothetical protein